MQALQAGGEGGGDRGTGPRWIRQVSAGILGRPGGLGRLCEACSGERDAVAAGVRGE